MVKQPNFVAYLHSALLTCFHFGTSVFAESVARFYRGKQHGSFELQIAPRYPLPFDIYEHRSWFEYYISLAYSSKDEN